jgi:hypothetical protein
VWRATAAGTRHSRATASGRAELEREGVRLFSALDARTGGGHVAMACLGGARLRDKRVQQTLNTQTISLLFAISYDF